MNVLTAGLVVAVVALLVIAAFFAWKWHDAEESLRFSRSRHKFPEPPKTTIYGELAQAAQREARNLAMHGYIDSAESLFLKAREYRKKDQEALMNGEIF